MESYGFCRGFGSHGQRCKSSGCVFTLRRNSGRFFAVSRDLAFVLELVLTGDSKPEGPNSTELHRGFGYVEFEDPEDVKDAIDNMDQSELFGKVIKVNPAKPPKNANEGLGSKTALWEQVRLSYLLIGLCH